MKIINRSIKLVDKLINTAVIIILLLALLISCYAIYDTFATYEQAELSDDILKYKPMNNGEKFSLESLQQDVNEDICGWIRINGTNIDYPILFGEDNSVYLNLNYKKEYSLTGSIYLDYRNNRDFTDDFSIVYGHNLKANLMFAEVKNFENSEYFNAHKDGILYANDKMYKIELFSFGNLNAYSSLYNLLLTAKSSNSTVLKEFDNISETHVDLDVKAKDKLIMLSTCNAAGSEDRAVLLGRLTEITDGSLNINEDEDISLDTIDKQLEEKQRAKGEIYNDQEEVKEKDDGYDWLRYVIVFVGLIVIGIEVYIYKKKEDEEEEKKIDEYNKVFYSSYKKQDTDIKEEKEKQSIDGNLEENRVEIDTLGKRRSHSKKENLLTSIIGSFNNKINRNKDKENKDGKNNNPSRRNSIKSRNERLRKKDRRKNTKRRMDRFK